MGQVGSFDERNRALAEHLADIALRRDADGRVSHITQRGCRTLELDADAVIGSSFEEFVHPDDRASVLPRVAKELESDPSTTGVLRMRKGDGSWLHIEATFMRYSPDSIVVFGSDVTEHRQQVEELRSREAQFRMVTDCVPAMVWMTDPGGKTVFANQATLDFVGEVTDASREAWNEFFVHPEDRSRLWAAVEPALESHQPFSVEARVLDRSGRYRWVHMTGQPRFGPDGDFQGHVGASFDITATKEAELSLHRSERLASLGNLSTGIAHEISDPLTLIRSAAEVALHALERKADSPAIEQSLRRILSHAKRASRIASGLQRFARTDPATPEPQDLNELVRGIVERMQGNIRAAQAFVDYELDPELKRVPMRRSELIYALSNLLQNAVESSERPVCVRVRTEGRDKWAFLTVTDDGDGVPEEVFNQIFDPFFTTRRRKGGTGLGLSLAQRIVRDHGGSIEVQSTLDRGTSFIISLPTEDA